MKIKVDGTQMVKLPEVTKAMLDLNLAKINKVRKEKLKPPITRGDLIAYAVERITVEDGLLI